MAVATRTDSTLAANWTQTTLFDAIKAALINAGFPNPVSDFTSGTDKIATYAVILDNTKAFGTTFLRVRITNAFIVAIQLFATWNSATNTGTGNSLEITNTALVPTTGVNFIALNAGNEAKLIGVQQGAIFYTLGFLSPANRPAWWDLASFNYCFIPTTNAFGVWRTTLQNPYANTEFDCNLNNTRMGSANTITSRRDILQGVVMLTQSNTGVSGRTSDDLVSVAASGATRFDTLQIPGSTNQYLLLNPSAGGLAIRIA